MTMTRSRMLEGTWYDHPQYYDIAFQVYTEREADFIEAACRKYCPFNARRLLEPACGTGRLVTALAARGYEVTGFDLSQPALSYLRRQITRRRLNVTTFEAEMSYFHLRRRVDAAYCTINTIRHLLTEETARSHLNSVAESRSFGYACWCVAARRNFVWHTNFATARILQANFKGCSLRFHRWKSAGCTIIGTTLSNRSRLRMKSLTLYLC